MDRAKRFGVLCLVLATLFWSFTHIFVKHLSLRGIDADVQNLYRYAAAAIGLWALALARFRGETLAAVRRWRTLVLPVLVNCAFQTTMVSALYRESIYPGLSGLLGKSAVVFAAVLAFVVYRDERRTIRSWRYLLGTGMAIAGVAGVILFGERARADFNEGVLLVVGAAFLWACYTLIVKAVVVEIRPVVAFAIVSTFTTIFFAALACIRSDPAQIVETTTADKGVIVFSGLLCISAAHTLYYRAIERLGVAVCSSFLLLTPLITGVASATIFKERLALAQILMGGVLLAGVYLSMRARTNGRA